MRTEATLVSTALVPKRGAKVERISEPEPNLKKYLFSRFLFVDAASANTALLPELKERFPQNGAQK